MEVNDIDEELAEEIIKEILKQENKYLRRTNAKMDSSKHYQMAVRDIVNLIKKKVIE